MDQWKTNTEKYSEDQIASVLDHIGVDIVGQTYTNYLCLCPFHGNDNTPALSISKESGLFMCFNPSCDQSGDLVKLVTKVANVQHFPALRIIAQYKSNKVSDLFTRKKPVKEDLPSFSQELLNTLYDNFWADSDAQNYMHDRGFDNKTLQEFKIGYSFNKQMIAIPMHDKHGNAVGVIGRSILGKNFENSKKLPTSRTLFNLHRAVRAGDKVIVVEAALDAMKIHQAGFPCVVALCMGSLSQYHIDYLDMYFNSIVIGTDYDNVLQHKKDNCNKCVDCQGHNPGRALGEKIASRLGHKRVKWLAYEHGVIYPNNAKDPGDMSIEQIRQSVANSVSNFEYNRWKRLYPSMAIV